MEQFTVRYDQLTAEEFITLWSSVWDGAPEPEQTRLAMEHSLVRLSVLDGSELVGMARMIGDMGLCCYIKDVIVRPDYQGRGVGRLLISKLLEYVRTHGVKGSVVSVELCAMPDKIPFYEQFGFSYNEAQRLRLYVDAD